jgi:hypothetical protein
MVKEKHDCEGHDEGADTEAAEHHHPMIERIVVTGLSGLNGKRGSNRPKSPLLEGNLNVILARIGGSNGL